MGDFKKLLKKGLVWSFIDNVLLKGMSFVITIFLARILEPNDFGLIAIVTIFISLGNALIEGGLGNSIIRDNTATSEDYNSVFYGNLMISLLLYPILYFTAPIIAYYFNNILITDLIRVYGVTFVISAFYYVQHSILMKNMLFKKITIYNIPAVVFGAIVGLFCAYQGFGVWSLIYMQVTTFFIKSFIYWFSSGWRPRIGFSFIHLKKHFNFGYKLMILSIIDAIIREVNSFVIGRSFSLNTLGFYNQARIFRNYPINLLGTIITSVTYPLLSKIQDDKEKIREVYSRVLQIFFFLISFFIICLIVIAKPLFILVFTEKWLTSVPYFQLLAIAGILTPVHAFNLNVFKICNRTDLFLKLGLIKVVLIAISLSIGVMFGVYGLLYAIIISSILGLGINTYYSEELINYSTKQQLRDMFPVVVYTVISFFCGSYILKLLMNKHEIVQVLVGVFVTSATFILVAITTKSKSLIEVKGLVQLFFKNNKK